MISNVYILDFVFVCVFLWNKTKYLSIRDMDIVKYFYWSEAMIILFYLYARPVHNECEKSVSFFMQLASLLLWYFIYYRKKINRKDGN